MKREIKFRVWWPDSSGEGGQMIANPSGSFQFLNDFFKEMSEEGTSWTFMQFTGLHDKNGMEIYEGDVFKPRNGSPNPCEVVWEVSLGVGLRDSAGAWQGKLAHQAIEGEVIGNIYENPDLIK